MKILLIYPPWTRFFNGSQPTFLLGLGYIAAVLESKGYDVSIYNTDFDKSAANEFKSQMRGEYGKFITSCKNCFDHSVSRKIK